MKRQLMIEDKIAFVDRAAKYFHYIFGPLIDGNLGKIEIRAFRKRDPVIQEFFDTELAAALHESEYRKHVYLKLHFDRGSAVMGRPLLSVSHNQTNNQKGDNYVGYI